LLERANGVPLYLEELPKAVLEVGGQTHAKPIALPATLRDSLMSQLDRMGESKAVAQTAAVLGHSFERPLLELVWDGDVEHLNEGLDVLADAALITSEAQPRTMNYGFRHALLAEIAYDSLLRDDRRRIHRRTAEILASHFQPLVDARPEILARHYESAESYEAAFECWLRAGKAAATRSANDEALAQLVSARDCLERISACSEETRLEKHLDLLLAQGPVLISKLGWAAQEVEDCYRLASRISRKLDLSSRDRFRILGGLFNVYLLRGDLRRAKRTMEQGHKAALKTDESEILTFSHRTLGLGHVMAAEFDQAIIHMNAVEKLLSSDPTRELRQTADYGTNPRVIALSIKAWSHWFKGDTGEADLCSSCAIEVAESACHPFSLCYALCLGASLAQFRRQVSEANTLAERALDLSTDYAFAYWYGWSKIVRGWSATMKGNPEVGLADLREGLDAYEATKASQMRGYGLTLLADALLYVKEPAKAFEAAEAALVEMKRTGIVFYKTEALRLHKDALTRRSD
jgi:hypothetical protein